MSSRGLRATLVALVVGCNSVIGVEQLPGATPVVDAGGDGSTADAGPAFNYAEHDCETCMAQHCAAQTATCVADSSCSALGGCLAAVKRGELQERAACYDDNELALEATPGAALDACRRDQCLDACLGTAGVLTTHGSDCTQCVDTSTTCQAAVTACFKNPVCERKLEYYVYKCPDNPDCRFQALYDVYNPASDAEVTTAANLVSEVRRCLTPCDSYCGICEDFTCVGAYGWSHAPVSQTSVTTTVRIAFADLTGAQTGPAEGVTVDVCAPQQGPGCDSVESSGQAASDGSVTVQLRLASGRFDGHFYAHGAAAFPTHFYVDRPMWRTVDDTDLSVFTSATFLQVVALAGGSGLDPTLGHLAVASYSCWRVLAGNLAMELDADAGTPFSSYVPFKNTATEPGVGAWAAVNVAPGVRKLTARSGADVIVDGYAVPVAPGELSAVVLFPDSSSQ